MVQIHRLSVAQDISNIMVNSDILCIPSIWAENSPGVVIHALSLGLPVIGSDKAGIPELVEDGKNGLLVPPGDMLAWQVALERILDPGALYLGAIMRSKTSMALIKIILGIKCYIL
jgi:glycosyltransferase involved in cell wall biosynthesis